MTPRPSPRRTVIARLIGGLALIATGASRSQSSKEMPPGNHRRWIEAAFAMKREAETSGDQPYGAVVVLDDKIIGAAPSRVIKLGNIDAHAEREAIKDAQQKRGRASLQGAVLYSSSRPCSLCERAAAKAQIARMIHGNDLRDAGAPQV